MMGLRKTVYASDLTNVLVVTFGSDLEVMIQLGYLARVRKDPPTLSKALRDAFLVLLVAELQH